MSAPTVARLRRDVAALRDRVRTERPPLSPVAVAARSGLHLDGWQRRVATSTARNQILLCGRQTGKSTVASLLAVHQATQVAGSTTIVTAPALRQSQLLYAKVRALHRALGDAVPPVVDESALRLVLANGATVIALPGSERGIRGYTANLVVEDEAGRVNDDTFAAVVPMLATTGGTLILLSSPAGQRGHFFDLWSAADPAWERTTVTSYDVARIDPGWLEEQRRSLPDRQFRAEFRCEFVETDDAVFRFSDIEHAFADNAITPLFGGSGHAVA